MVPPIIGSLLNLLNVVKITPYRHIHAWTYSIHFPHWDSFPWYSILGKVSIKIIHHTDLSLVYLLGRYARISQLWEDILSEVRKPLCFLLETYLYSWSVMWTLVPYNITSLLNSSFFFLYSSPSSSSFSLPSPLPSPSSILEEKTQWLGGHPEKFSSYAESNYK